jgi:carbamoyl-phosphate synthase large subunit
MHRVDKAHVVPRIDSGGYIEALLDIARRGKVNLLIPLLDVELFPIASAVEAFEQAGCRALISSHRVVSVCRDKLMTHRALNDAGIDTPKTWTWEEALARTQHTFPYFMKPRAGSAGVGNYTIRNVDQLQTFGKLVHEPIVQEFIDGVEHTLDVYTGFDGAARCVVPRKRLEVRNGEVSKAIIVKDRALMDVGRRVAEMLGECRGVVTVQCMVTEDRKIRVIEINPRFGGGAPLAIHAGADFPKWILSELTGNTPHIDPTGFEADVAMLRFDDSVFVPGASKFLDTEPVHKKVANRE